jgi:hypothetical protein
MAAGGLSAVGLVTDDTGEWDEAMVDACSMQDVERMQSSGVKGMLTAEDGVENF